MITIDSLYAEWLNDGSAMVRITDSRQSTIFHRLILGNHPLASYEGSFDEKTEEEQFISFDSANNKILVSKESDISDNKEMIWVEPCEIFIHSEENRENGNSYTAEEYNEAYCLAYKFKTNKNNINNAENISAKKENDTMNSNKIFGNFDFGKVDSDKVRASMYGLAVKDKSGKWVSFDSNSQQVIDVDAFNFKAEGFAFKMPVALSSVAVSDLIYHHGNLMFVTKVNKNSLKAVDINCGEVKEIIPIRNMFNFNFVTKVVSLLSCFSGSASPDSPFGNLLPLMLMDNKNDDDMMLPLMLMMNQQNGNQMQNMMLPLMMMGKDKSDMMLPLMLMINGGQFPGLTPTAPAKKKDCED